MRSRAFPSFCEVACLPWFFHSELLLRVQILGSPAAILPGAQHLFAGILFPPAWLSCLALLWFRYSEIPSPLACLWCRVPFCLTDSRLLRRARAGTQLHAASVMLSQQETLFPQEI